MADYIIDFKLKKNGRGKLNIDGNCPDLVAGVLTMVKRIHKDILLNSGETAANWFLEHLGDALTNPGNPLYEEVRK